MLFNSASFLIFFPIAALGYFLLPHKVRYLWLLGCSYYFYMCWNPVYALLMLASTAITFFSGTVMERVKHATLSDAQKTGWKKTCVAVSVLLNLGILAYFKYFNFFITNINGLLAQIHVTYAVPTVDVLLPVGISFYTFQALSYTIDVYRDDIYAETNFFRYALFVSFFPQLVAGPIERSKNLLVQLQEKHTFSFENLRTGFLQMLWGYFLKLVLADRIAVFVNTVYGDYATYGGFYLIVASILFAFQIYCDFAGYSTIAMGAARIMGFTLTENFKAPYLATSVADFWRRWHISLSSWFRDYLYIPLGGNRKGTVRKYCNLLIVFFCSGLWHGAQWTYIVWGLLNGIYQVAGQLLRPVRDFFVRLFRLNRNSFSHRVYQTLFTFALVDLAWVFFRATRLSEAIPIFKSMFTADNLYVLFDRSLYNLGLNERNFVLMLLGIAVLLIADLLKERGISFRAFLYRQEGWFRIVTVALFTVAILVFGMYGPGYDASAFIYFQF